ncbi:alkaline phosphatase family protein [Pseudomonas savastanoi]|uniref:alkaline phosphatase family protein n=1 Tax=Pseudomonas savastanoi TaxID=29438 RepID=UPI001E6536B0|nr:alkaline phosphatase family protein [Pseudomonas savastanoi]UFI47372.1 alkaline phosphatase family protein [Pseudomonas savastanoi]
MKGVNPLIWLLIDGLSWELVNRYRARKPEQPSAGWPFYPLLPLSPNCQTPPSLLSIFSGTQVSEHGLTGYLVPAPTPRNCLAVADAFQAWPRDIDMVWDEWARQGITFRLCAVPFVQPDRLGSALLGQSCVYEGFSVPPELIENGGHLRIERLEMAARVSSREGGAMLDWPEEDGRAPCWLPLGSTVHLPLPEKGPGNVCKAIALRAVCVEDRISVVSFGYQEVQALDLQSDKSKAYVARDLTVLYRSGQLGKRLDEGGQGTAEWLLLELMREVHESFCSDIVGAVRAGDAQRVIGYYPVVDLLSHHLLKYLTPDWASERMREVGQQLFDEVSGWVDELIQRCMDAAGGEVRCVAHSDHGMAPVHHDLYPNAFFERQGWLVYDSAGVPDMQKSAVVFHPADNGLLLFHEARLAMSGHDPRSVTEAWRQSLAQPFRHEWTMFEYPGEQCFPEGWTGSCYWQAPRGSRLVAARSEHCVRLSRKGGDHTVCASDPWLRGVVLDASSTPLPCPANAELTLPEIRQWLTAAL